MEKPFLLQVNVYTEEKNSLTTSNYFKDKGTQTRRPRKHSVTVCPSLTTAVMMRRQQIYKNHICIPILVILKVIILSLKDAELQGRQITRKWRQRTMSNATDMHEINETLRRTFVGK